MGSSIRSALWQTWRLKNVLNSWGCWREVISGLRATGDGYLGKDVGMDFGKEVHGYGDAAMVGGSRRRI